MGATTDTTSGDSGENEKKTGGSKKRSGGSSKKKGSGSQSKGTSQSKSTKAKSTKDGGGKKTSGATKSAGKSTDAAEAKGAQEQKPEAPETTEASTEPSSEQPSPAPKGTATQSKGKPMQVECDVGVLSAAVDEVERVAKSRGTSMPVLETLRLSPSPNGEEVELVGTTLTVGKMLSVRGELHGDESFCIDAKRLAAVLRSFNSGKVRITSGGEVRCGKSRFRLRTMPGEDFPPPPEPETNAKAMVIEAQVLRRAIQSARTSMAKDDTRPHLAGIQLEIGDSKMNAIATDGHRLSVVTAKVGAKQKLEVFIPHVAVDEIAKAGDRAGNLELTVGRTYVFVENDDKQQVWTRIGDDSFPPWRKLIEAQKTKVTIEVKRESLVEAVRRSTLVSKGGKHGIVSMHATGGEVQLSSETEDIGASEESVEADIKGGDATVHFNPAYLHDALRGVESDVVRIRLGGDHDPGVIESVDGEQDSMHVIMPIRPDAVKPQ